MTETQTRPQTTTAPATTNISSTARTLTVVAFVCAGIAVFLLPIVFGIAGIVCASVAMAKGDTLGKWALTASVAGLAVGLVLAYAVLQANS
jgi:hypothetical protein